MDYETAIKKLEEIDAEKNKVSQAIKVAEAEREETRAALSEARQKLTSDLLMNHLGGQETKISIEETWAEIESLERKQQELPLLLEGLKTRLEELRVEETQVLKIRNRHDAQAKLDEELAAIRDHYDEARAGRCRQLAATLNVGPEVERVLKRAHDQWRAQPLGGQA